MDKNSICQLAIDNIKNAKQMQHVYTDPKTGERKVDYFEVTDSARKSAIDAIEQYQNSNKESFLIFHGEDSVADYLYYLEIRDGILVLLIITDAGMKFHHVYYTPEEMLYCFDCLEKDKPKLNRVDEPHRKL